MVEVPNDNQLMKSKKQWCLCPLNSDDMLGDILLPDQGEVKIGRAILGISDRKISRNHLGLRIQDKELSVKLLHKNPCHVKKAGQSIAQDIPSDRFMTLVEGDQISLMCTYAYAVDFKDVTAAQPPKFRTRTSSVLTTATEDSQQFTRSQSTGSRHHYVNYEPVPHFERDVVAEEDEVIDDALPQGDLDSHMSWRDPDKEVPGPDRYHQDWLVIDVTEEVAKVAPEIKARYSDEDDGSMFSNHSEEKCSYRVLYSQNQAQKSKTNIWRNMCGNTPKQHE